MLALTRGLGVMGMGARAPKLACATHLLMRESGSAAVTRAPRSPQEASFRPLLSLNASGLFTVK